MGVGGVRGPDGVGFEGTQGADAPHAQAAAKEATVTRTPTSSRPDPARVARRMSGERVLPLDGNPLDYLTTEVERQTYDWVVKSSDKPIGEILDHFDALSPASYNRLLHAFALTRVPPGAGEPGAPKGATGGGGGKGGALTLLDKLVARGGSEPGKAKLAERFFKQVANKLAGQPGRILEHLAAETRTRLEAQPGWGRIAPLLGG